MTSAVHQHEQLPQVSHRNLERDSLELENAPLSLTSPSHLTQQKTFSKERVIYILSLLIFALILGSLHYYFMRYDTYNHQNRTFFHDDHEIYIKNELQHDRACYTQGLSYLNKTHLIESCGFYGQSYFHILEYNKDALTQQIKEVYKSQIFPKNIFIQGSVFFPKNQLLYVLTWREHIVYRYEIKNGQFVAKDKLKWNRLGWGMTHNGQNLIISDGTDKLYVVDQNLTVVRNISIFDQDKHPKTHINDLQYVLQENIAFIYANVYLTDTIIKIDFDSGLIVETYKFANIVAKEPQTRKNDEVLNGLAYDVHHKEFLITGKRWKSFYVLDKF